jgi:hypothetical protein
LPSPIANLLRWAWLFAEIVALSALILVTRGANYDEVFVGGRIYFVDADCYSRMTRARLVVQHPGLIVRQHDFENFPAGITPHTTAPFDYLIVALAKVLSPFTAQPLDLAGALISPLLALGSGWFLWWWSRRLGFRYRWTGLLLFALSPILAHGSALGRPDHQSLLMALLLVALAAEWSLQREASGSWAIVSGLSWGMALWVSLYEPLLLLAALLGFHCFCRRAQLWERPRRIGWYLLLGMFVLAALIERRWPQLPAPALHAFFVRWSATVGELRGVSLTSAVWWQWGGALLVVAPLFFILALKRRAIPPAFALLFAVALLLTIWQARWGYFLLVIFALTTPALLDVVRQGWLGGLLFFLALLPVLQSWEHALRPNEQLQARRAEARAEASEWRAASRALPRDHLAPFLAPWWLSPSAAYWSGQPAVAGSSHESLPGIVASARFFLTRQSGEAHEILHQGGVQWVLVYDAERVAENSAAILGEPASPDALCFTLDRTPSRAPAFLRLAGQNNACKLYQVRN